MADLIIGNLDKATMLRLQARATKNGRLVEDEVREILLAAVKVKAPKDQYSSIRAKIEPLGGVELELPSREAGHRKPPSF